MCFVAVRCAEAISGTKRRTAPKHISFDSSRRAEQNLSSAHRLVEFSTRYRRFSLRMRSNAFTAHAQTKTPISRRDLNQSMRR